MDLPRLSPRRLLTLLLIAGLAAVTASAPSDALLRERATGDESIERHFDGGGRPLVNEPLITRCPVTDEKEPDGTSTPPAPSLKAEGDAPALGGADDFDAAGGNAATLGVCGPLEPTVPTTAAQAPSASPVDFNCDGREDMIISAPGESFSSGEYGYPLAGQISVIHGLDTGAFWPPSIVTGEPYPATRLLRYGLSPELPDDFVPTSLPMYWGEAIAVGDFDGNGCTDAVVTSESDRWTHGSAVVLYGIPGQGLGRNSATMTTLPHEQLLQMGAPGPSSSSTTLPSTSSSSEQFGSVVSSGDFDGDGFDDLVFGLETDRDEGEFPDHAGRVIVAFGGPAGIDESRSLSIAANDPGMPTEPNASLGASAVPGDFDCDGRDEIAVAAASFDPALERFDGGLVVFDWDTGANAFLPVEMQYFDGTGAGAPVGTSWTDMIHLGGIALDVDADGCDDLVAGLAGVVANGVETGAIGLFHGAPGGLFAPDGAVNPAAAPATLIAIDGAAYSFAAGDLTGNGQTDLAVGVPSAGTRGEVLVWSSSSLNAGAPATVTISGLSAGVGTSVLGRAVVIRDFDADGTADLAYSDHQRNIASDLYQGAVAEGAGAVFVVEDVFGPRTTTQMDANMPGLSFAEYGDEFGWAIG